MCRMLQIFPQVIREVGSGFCHMYFYFLEFALVKISVAMMSIFGMTTTYCIFLSIVLTGSIVLIFIVPKTDKITLQQIEDNLTTK